MINSVWIDHLRTWKEFLSGYLSDQTDPGEIVKIVRQLKTIERARCAAVLNPSLLSLFINPENVEYDSGFQIDAPVLDLNDSQMTAVNHALCNSDLSLIQGPPGTGKTQVISEICLQLIKRNPFIRILVCSETHVAVNNLIARISKYNDQIRIVRIRDKEKDNQIDDYSPETIIGSYLEWIKSKQVDEDVYEILRSELSDSEEKSIEKALALSSNIVGVTCNRLASYDFRDSTEMFDVAIIDEVCKATLPEILAPLLISKKAILLGDPKQLPPVFCSEELSIIKRIDGCNLDKYMYIDDLLSSKSAAALDVQYRMSKEISNMISNVFYDGNLKDGRNESVKDGLKWLTYKPTKNWPVNSNSDRPQVYNDDECKIIKELVDDLINNNDSVCSIAIITPYQAQVQHIKRTIGDVCNVFVDTVDGFQGKESDVVIFSMTRTHGSYRFLADPRRLNVALSRARDRIIIVGEQKYCQENTLLRTISEYFDIENTEA